MTLLIAGYILWLTFSEISGSIRLLMLGTPSAIDTEALVADLQAVEGVRDAHHVHVWSIDEHKHAVDAHVVVPDGSGAEADAVRMRVKLRLKEKFGIGHSTIEIEQQSEACDDPQEIGHAVGRN